MVRQRSSRHVAIRTCVGCGVRAPQCQLLRFGLTENGNLAQRSSGAPRGRSAYLHPERECWERFATRKGTLVSLRRAIPREERRRFTATLAQTDRILSRLC